jgi:integrase
MLTEIRCRSAKPKAKAYKLADERGLYLFITPAGTKSWRKKYRFMKKEKVLTFGTYPELSLAEARDKRAAAERLLQEGIDPGIERRQRAAMAETEALNTFEILGRHWHETQLATWTPKYGKLVLTSLVDEVFPAFGDLPVKSITPPLVLERLKEIEKRGAVETAHRIRQRMSAIFVFGIACGLADNDPAAIVQGALKPIKKGRRPAARKIEAARDMLALVEAAKAHPTTKLGSRLLALTAVRPGMIRFAEPQEFEGLDTDEPIWRIPAAKMKGELEQKEDEAFEFLVPLSRQAVDVVKAALRLTSRAPYVFPNTHNAQLPMSENSISYLYKRQPEVKGKLVPHGWRSTFSTIMNERAIELDRPGDRAIIDLMLAHKPAGVEAIYNRAAYMGRRRQLAQDWADMLLEGLPPAEQLLVGPRK